MSGERKRFVVVADDQMRFRIEVGVALDELGQHVEVRTVDNVTALFDHARFGRLGDQPDWTEADAVTLDDNYGRDKTNWIIASSPHKKRVDTKLEEAGMNESQRQSVLGYPNSINLATALRAAGYRGDVIVVSNGPPHADMINNVTRSLDVRKPVINGTLLKKTFDGHAIYSNIDADVETGEAVEKSNTMKGNLTDALRKLLGY